MHKIFVKHLKNVRANTLNFNCQYLYRSIDVHCLWTDLDNHLVIIFSEVTILDL